MGNNRRVYVNIDAAYSDKYCKVWIPKYKQGALLTNRQFYSIWGNPTSRYQVDSSYKYVRKFIEKNYKNKELILCGQSIEWIEEDRKK